MSKVKETIKIILVVAVLAVGVYFRGQLSAASAK